MPALRIPAALQDVEKANYIGFNVGMGLVERMAHSRLRGEMNNVGKRFRRK